MIKGKLEKQPFFNSLLGSDEEWPELCRKLAGALTSKLSVEDFAASLGLGRGVSGYAYHTVPVALYAWLRHPSDFRAALESALNCGGDTDSVGAIVGALCGARQGAADIPTIVRAVYIGLDPRLVGAAGLSVLAHLEVLLARGLVTTDGEPSLQSIYRLP